MFSKIHGRSFASKSEVYWVDFDPKDYSRVAFHCSNGRTGVINMKQNNHATSSLGVITHAHCPPNPWTSTAPTRITRDEAERFIGAEGAWAYRNGDRASPFDANRNRRCHQLANRQMEWPRQTHVFVVHGRAKVNRSERERFRDTHPRRHGE